MLDRLRRAAARVAAVYWSWRLPLVLVIGVSLAIGVVLMPAATNRVGIAAALVLAVAAALSLHGLDVSRQDRLRSTVVSKRLLVASSALPATRARKPMPEAWKAHRVGHRYHPQ